METEVSCLRRRLLAEGDSTEGKKSLSCESCVCVLTDPLVGAHGGCGWGVLESAGVGWCF